MSFQPILWQRVSLSSLKICNFTQNYFLYFKKKCLPRLADNIDIYFTVKQDYLFNTYDTLHKHTHTIRYVILEPIHCHSLSIRITRDFCWMKTRSVCVYIFFYFKLQNHYFFFFFYYATTVYRSKSWVCMAFSAIFTICSCCQVEFCAAHLTQLWYYFFNLFHFYATHVIFEHIIKMLFCIMITLFMGIHISRYNIR